MQSRTTTIFFINDMPLSSHTAQFILFADYTNLLFTSKDLSSLTINVNSQLTKISHWISANKRSLNTGKTKCVFFKPLKIRYSIMRK